MRLATPARRWHAIEKQPATCNLQPRDWSGLRLRDSGPLREHMGRCSRKCRASPAQSPPDTRTRSPRPRLCSLPVAGTAVAAFTVSSNPLCTAKQNKELSWEQSTTLCLQMYTGRPHPAIVGTEAAFVGILTYSGGVRLVPTLADALKRPECVLASGDLPPHIA
eukprot:3810570-Rhodomonas_salina.3